MRSTYQTKKECFGKDENGNPASDKTSLMILVAEKHKLEFVEDDDDRIDSSTLQK